ncbi:MAG: hypothetical protein Rpha_0361 [Candidatus Ruthia sp. Apha_13_S6]|nr:hypothetical protein [Candidatus Ruthia sp. Apha_13_S6]
MFFIGVVAACGMGLFMYNMTQSVARMTNDVHHMVKDTWIG